MDSNPVFRLRPYEDADLENVYYLFNLCDAIDKLEDHFSIEGFRQQFSLPSIDRFEDQKVWEGENGALVAFAQVWHNSFERGLGSYFSFRVHPEARGTAVEDELMQWAARRSHTVGEERGLRPVLMGRIFEHDTYSRELFEKYGFTTVRYGFRMTRSLSDPLPEPVFPEGYALRHAQGEEDIEPWVDCYNESFVDHWGFHPETVEERRHRLKRPGYRPEQDLVAIAPDGKFVAFCLWHMDETGNALTGRKEGWIGVLGTRRGHRGKGLGRAMLLAGMQRLRDEGADTAKLGVDAENPTGALGLYERVGFVKVATRVSYHKDV